MYGRLAQFASPPGTADLPLPDDAARQLRGDPDLAMQMLAYLEAVEWKWTITQILEQPEALLEDVLTLAGWTGVLRRQNEQKT